MLFDVLVVLGVCVFLVIGALIWRSRNLGSADPSEIKTSKSLAIVVMLLILALLLAFVAAIVSVIGDTFQMR